MRKTKIAAALMSLGVAVAGLSLTTAPAATAAPTLESVRADFRALALENIAKVDALDGLTSCGAGREPGKDGAPARCRYGDDLPAWVNAYRAELEAFKQGTWNNTKTTQYLNNVFASQKIPGGYGRSTDWDWYGDGHVEPADTVVTVTTSEHVGPTIIRAYQAGVVPAYRVSDIVDALMAQPIESTPYGPCMSYYSDSQNDPKHYCTINVSAGAAAFLQQAADAGVVQPGQLELADSLRDSITGLYEAGAAEDGTWPYSYRITDGGFTQPDGQDWNHNAFTAESAHTLGLAVGNDSYLKKLSAPNYALDNDGAINPFEVVGRLRAQGIRTSLYPENTLADAQYYQQWVDSQPLGAVPTTSLLQAAMWEARLASIDYLVAGTGVPYTATTITKPDVYVNGDKDGNGVAVDNSTLVLRSKVSFVNDRGERVYVPFKEVRLARIGSGVLEAKTTSPQGDIAFVTQFTRDSCYELRIPADDLKSPQYCLTVK